MMDLVISDVDGTLLDHETNSFEKALPGLALLRNRSIPLVFCSSKTRSEVEYWRARIGNDDPFIVENGGAVYVPERCVQVAPASAQNREEYLVVQLGAAYAELVASLREASARSGCRVRGFHEMTVDEVGRLCGLDPPIAALAKKREFDEPFRILDEDKEADLVAAIEAAGRHCTRGGRFHHIIGNNDKAAALGTLLDLYRPTDPRPRTVGLGDGLNDAPFLNAVDVPILIRTPWLDRLQAAVPRGRPTASPGPGGWSEAILSLFA